MARRKHHSQQARAQKTTRRYRRESTRSREKLLVVAFTVLTSLLLPMYFQYQSNLSQNQLTSQLATVEVQQNTLLTQVAPSPQLSPLVISCRNLDAAMPTLTFPTNGRQRINFNDVSVVITIVNCGALSG
jgi:hypothetical protein